MSRSGVVEHTASVVVLVGWCRTPLAVRLRFFLAAARALISLSTATKTVRLQLKFGTYSLPRVPVPWVPP